jgi:hypothetical protein
MNKLRKVYQVGVDSLITQGQVGRLRKNFSCVIAVFLSVLQMQPNIGLFQLLNQFIDNPNIDRTE